MQDVVALAVGEPQVVADEIRKLAEPVDFEAGDGQRGVGFGGCGRVDQRVRPRLR